MRFPRPGLTVIAFILTLLRNEPCAADEGMETMDAKGRWPSDIERDFQEGARTARQVSERKAADREAFEDRISLAHSEEVCVARHLSKGACLLTVGEFNARVPLFTRGKGDSSAGRADSADLTGYRRKILESLAEKIFLEGRLLDDGDPSLRQSLRKAEEDRARDLKSGADTATLKALYRKHQDALFSRRRMVTVEFLAASDSAFLDSLRMLYQGPSRPAAGPGSAGSVDHEPPDKRDFIWQRADARDLPKEAAGPISSLKPGVISRPIFCGFGWIIASPVEILDLPAVSYEAALPRLLALDALPAPRANATPPFPTSTHPEASSAVAGKDVEDPDVRAWLIPYARSRTRAVAPSSWMDTAGLRPMSLRLSALPPSVLRKAAGILPWRTSARIKDKHGVHYLRAPRRLSETAFPKESPSGGAPNVEAALREMEGIMQAKARDFRMSFVKSRLERSSPEADGARLRQKWIDENVAFDTAQLDR